VLCELHVLPLAGAGGANEGEQDEGLFHFEYDTRPRRWREKSATACAHVTDDEAMLLALDEAQTAAAKGEVPVGAVIIHDGKVVGRGHNLRETQADPLAHAEILAISDAAKALGRWRLFGCTLVVTLEPCPMCAGAIVNARIDRVVYGAPDPRAGAAGTIMDIVRDGRLNHRAEVVSGVRADESADLLKSFFAAKRRSSNV
jgi:tRNA(adenine34) deaminase